MQFLPHHLQFLLTVAEFILLQEAEELVHRISISRCCVRHWGRWRMMQKQVMQRHYGDLFQSLEA